MRFQEFLMSIILLLHLTPSSAQIQGLWGVDKVAVGEQEMTPTAKWFELKETGRCLGGSGGIINSRTSYDWDETTLELTFTDDISGVDEFGAFTVEYSNSGMIWQREENGQLVSVYLSRIVERPLAAWDKIAGMWTLDLEDLPGEEQSALPFENLFFRWDHIVIVNRRIEGKDAQRGIWQIDGHRSSLWLVFDDSDHGLGNSHWDITFENGKLLLKGEHAGARIGLRFARP